jgi:hypothetical protein
MRFRRSSGGCGNLVPCTCQEWVGTADLVAGVYQEYRKLGRLILEREFGEYFPQLHGTTGP